MPKKMYSPKEVANILGVTRRTIYRKLDAGDMKGRKIGGVWKIPYSALVEYVGEEEFLKEMLPEEE